ncbi:MAG: hypothetical protein LBC82_02475 [Oscillospiraceae bacterium]|jgi:predicted RNA-binding Zn-ribbon protein involved in translation (DUF1610 family)|nr:hypothetical protein [Oscillospiraceae bacterium]
MSIIAIIFGALIIIGSIGVESQGVFLTIPLGIVMVISGIKKLISGKSKNESIETSVKCPQCRESLYRIYVNEYYGTRYFCPSNSCSFKDDKIRAPYEP